MFNKDVLKSWQTPKVEHHHKEKKEEKKVEAAKKEDDGDDLFGGDDEADKEAADALKKKKEAEVKAAAEQKAKKTVIAKTMVVFNVKILEEEQDLDKLAAKIFAIEKDGLTWNKNYKKPEVAFGIKMLEMVCVVEDLKVSTDELFDEISIWEDEVQSVDMVSMQKIWGICEFACVVAFRVMNSMRKVKDCFYLYREAANS